MPVAALYDVHGNLPALDAVLAEVPDDAEIVVGGDIAYGPYPSETVERLRALGDRVHWLRGNADRELTPGEDAGLTDPGNIEWVRAQLAPEQIAFLHGLPPTVTLEIDGLGRVLFCHATPQNDLDVFTERTPEERVRPSFAEVTDDLVVVGHTHIQFDRIVGGLRIVNAGSVGMAYEDAPDAYWTLLGPAVAHRHSAFEPDLGDYPGEWPSASRDEATTYFETLALGS